MVDRLSCLVGQFEPHGLARLPLQNGGSVRQACKPFAGMAAMATNIAGASSRSCTRLSLPRRHFPTTGLTRDAVKIARLVRVLPAWRTTRPIHLVFAPEPKGHAEAALLHRVRRIAVRVMLAMSVRLTWRSASGDLSRIWRVLADIMAKPIFDSRTPPYPGGNVNKRKST